MLTGLTTFVSNLLGAYEQQLAQVTKERDELKAKVDSLTPKETKE